MIIYSSDIAGFKKDLFRGSLIEKLDRQVAQSFGRVGVSERLSWQNSLHFMNTVVSNADLPSDSGVAIEYMIPTTSKRIDFLISGYDDNDHPNVVVIELKQWSETELSDTSEELIKTFVGGRKRDMPHPSYQAWSYTQLLKDFNTSVQDGSIKLHPCAYLHNYMKVTNDALKSTQFEDLLKESPFFDMHGGPALSSFINKFVRKGDNRKILYYIDNGRIRPSKSLQDSITNMLEGNKTFIMIDDQKVVYEHAIAMAEKTKRDNKKRVMIVEGGPGTGKSVVAINLLAELINRGLTAQYITKNAAPRDVYKTKLKGTRKTHSIDNLFQNSSGYYNVDENTIDIAIVDEAHRLNEKSGFFRNLGDNQVMEIIRSSKCSIFFVDDRQMITLQDIGEVEEIRKQATRLNAEITHEQLMSQFRCNGSDGYIAWLEDVLQIRETANKFFDLDYDFDVVDSPQELMKWVIDNNNNNKARAIAGYCWNWPTGSRADTNHHDIHIEEYDFSMSWNLNEGIWAIDPNSVNEIGCIHTSQGLEFEYVGIIIGPDMYYDGVNVRTDYCKRAKSDQSLRGIKKMEEEDPEGAAKIADTIIRNTYRTLLTRGMKGCRVFCTDKALGKYLKSRLKDKYQILFAETENDSIAAENDDPYDA